MIRPQAWTRQIGYAKGYEGGLSIEPHSANWHGELGERGIDYTVRYFRELML